MVRGEDSPTTRGAREPLRLASTTSDAGGNWYKKVFFTGPPFDTPFTVTVEVGDTVYYFQMVVHPPS